MHWLLTLTAIPTTQVLVFRTKLLRKRLSQLWMWEVHDQRKPLLEVSGTFARKTKSLTTELYGHS